MDALKKLISLAKERNELKSNRQLSFKLGLSPSVVSYWLQGSSTPSSDAFIELCRLAGVEPEKHLLNHHAQNAAPKNKAIWLKIRDDLAGKNCP
jgi:transcriptional regulator with XRE-family HTH domain